MPDQEPARRRWLRFSLRTLLVVMLLVGVGLGVLGMMASEGGCRKTSVHRRTFWQRSANIWKAFAMRRELITCLVLLSSATARANTVVLDEPADLDLSGIVTAINFGDTTDQVIGGVKFRAAPANATVQRVTNRAIGAVKVGQHGQTLPELGSGKDDDAMEQLLGTSIFGCDTGSTNIELDIPVPNGYYRAQLILYDGWQSVTGNRRDVDHYVEGTLAAAHCQDYVQQNRTPNAGSLATYVFEVTDGQIDIDVVGLIPNAHLSGLIISRLSLSAGQKSPTLNPGETWVAPDATGGGDPEPRQQYITLQHDLARRDMFEKVADQTFRREASIVETDRDPTDIVLRRTAALLADIQEMPTASDLSVAANELKELQAAAADVTLPESAARYALFEKVCRLRRKIAFANPLLRDFDEILFIKRHGSLYSHMVDQFYGITAQPGGGLYVLSDAFGPEPKVRDVLADSVILQGRLAGEILSGGPSKKWDINFHDNTATLRGEETEGGAFLSPDLSFDGRQILFAYTECRGDRSHRAHSDHSRGHWAEGRCYHIFKINLDGSGLVQLTDGTFNDFDPCWMPSGRIVFNSERRGGYLRCGRICPTYTLHDMAADGRDIRRLSFHETHEWHPSVIHDGRIIFTRWDYIDRWSSAAHMPWIMAPDGRDPRAIQGNFSDRMTRPDMEVDLRAIPGSQKFIATATGHHSQVFGSLVILDPRIVDNDQMSALKRLTPDVEFPENQAQGGPGGWDSDYGEAWPLSEDYHLCVYDAKARIAPNTPLGANYGIYLLDSFGNRELIYRDPEISAHNPIPVRPRKVPPVIPDASDRVAEDQPAEAVVGVVNVYNSSKPWPVGTKIKALRVYQVFPLPIASWAARHNTGLQIPGTNSINIARAVLGTVPVEKDGSAHFIAPARKELFFQVLDEDGLAVTTMRSGTQFLPGEVATCRGCHEPRHTAVTTVNTTPPLAMRRPPSRLKPDVDGTNPFSYPRLVQPVLDRHCVECHATHPDKPMRLDSGSVEDPAGGWMNIPTTYYASYLSLAPKYGTWRYATSASSRSIDRDLESTPGKVGARASKLYEILEQGHYDVKLSEEDMHRIMVWLDSYSPFYGVYEPEAGKLQLRGEVVHPALE